MKIGYRKPSLKKSFKASTTGKLKRELKRSVNPYYGKKGTGMITDPKKSVYNKVYKQTTVQTPAPRFGENEKATSKSIKNNSENEIKIDKANNEQESVPQKNGHPWFWAICAGAIITIMFSTKFSFLMLILFAFCIWKFVDLIS